MKADRQSQEAINLYTSAKRSVRMSRTGVYDILTTSGSNRSAMLWLHLRNQGFGKATRAFRKEKEDGRTF